MNKPYSYEWTPIFARMNLDSYEWTTQIRTNEQSILARINYFLRTNGPSFARIKHFIRTNGPSFARMQFIRTSSRFPDFQILIHKLEVNLQNVILEPYLLKTKHKALKTYTKNIKEAYLWWFLFLNKNLHFNPWFLQKNVNESTNTKS